MYSYSYTFITKYMSFHCDIWPQKWSTPTKTEAEREKEREEEAKRKNEKKIDHKFNDYDHFYHNKYWYNRNRYSYMISRALERK